MRGLCSGKTCRGRGSDRHVGVEGETVEEEEVELLEEGSHPCGGRGRRRLLPRWVGESGVSGADGDHEATVVVVVVVAMLFT